jgi:hypothetical protein
MKRLLHYYSFIVVSIMALIGFTSAQSVGQLIPAVLFFPLAVYFGILITPKRSKAILLPKFQVPPQKLNKEEKISEGKVTKLKGFDMDRRAFLKIIGSAGLTVFFFSIFAKRAEAAFFGSVPGPGTVALKDSAGAIIDPAIKHPTDGYKINQMDDTSDPPYAYYGFANKDGAWFIMRETTSGVDEGQYRYRKGSSGFPAGWGGRTANPETYDYFDEIFD